MKLKTRYGNQMKCICGNNEFKITYKDKSYLINCTQCGMFCGCVDERYNNINTSNIINCSR